jgi:predicted metalloprotease
VKWTRGTKNSDVIDARGRAPKAGVAVAGGGLVVTLLVVLAARVFGVDVSGLLGGGGGGAAAPASQSSAPPQGPDPDAELVDFVRFAMGDIQDTFEAMFRAEGRRYERAKLVLFSRTVDTACGRSSSEIGPFYCPADSHAYIDLSFYRELRTRFGAPGDFAQAYVLAHEIGHHLQNLFDVGASRSNAHSVRVELQADCYAGIWGKAAQGKRLLEVGDLEEAITAAAAIGDDRLQKQAGVEVNPEAFTHGTSAQRMAWFRRGFEAGRFAACDTFAVDP